MTFNVFFFYCRFKSISFCCYNNIIFIAVWILLFIYIAMTGFVYVELAIWIVATVVILFCFYKNHGWFGKEKEMIKQLQELIDMK